ncbi:PQQ-binding-like beta-propeller repeat protein [Methylophilaceae bacterium]|nr:PQQ-binding-like beta-propeller repeat protein [Methylophilaceae bacterium]
MFSIQASSVNSESYDTQWPRSFGGDRSKAYSDADQINKINVKKLKKIWQFNSGAILDKETIQTPPILANNVVVTSTIDGFLVGLEPDSGKVKWKTAKLPAPVARRGLTFSNGNIYVPTSAGIYVVDHTNGLFLRMKSSGKPAVYGANLSFTPPIVTNKSIIVAHYGYIASYDLNTTNLLWQLSLKKKVVSTRVWSGISYDNNLNIVYISTSNPVEFIGTNIGDGEYSCSLIAIDGSTGKILWQFQDTEHDVWDFDVVGPPLLTKIKVNAKTIPVVIALSKTGNILMVNRKSGKPIFDYSYQLIDSGDFPNHQTSKKQKKFTLPEPISSINFNMKNDVTKLSKEQEDYVRHKIRNAKGGNYPPSSLKNDVVLFGINGGPEWPGGSIDNKNRLVIPSNKYPNIIRAWFTIPNNNIDNNKEIISLKSYQTYLSNCASCHMANLSGSYENEYTGDNYFPSLVGISRIKSKESLTSLKEFKYAHKYSNDSKSVGSDADDYEIQQSDLDELYNLFIKVDKITKPNQVVASDFQILLDNHKLPGSNPPWGYISSTDLNSGKILWKVPFGIATDKITKKEYSGDMNFGGLITTKSGLIIATGTRDEYSRFYDSDNGKELFKVKLPYAGSSPPFTYMYKGCQYIGFNSSGGRFTGYGKNGDAFVVYKLRTCVPESST